MRYIRYLFLGLIVAALVVLGMANRDMVTLNVLPPALAALVGWNFSISLPLFITGFAGVAIGLLLGYVLEWIREAKHRAEVSKRQRQVKELNREVTQLKAERNRGKDDVLAILDDAAGRKKAS